MTFDEAAMAPKYCGIATFGEFATFLFDGEDWQYFGE